ncbi:GtrA family protein [Sulfolobus tengchongensis]|uniref:GtrA family protein n=1 Tax=Sulfolobus tengchongensis TaxID=207809 RepID=A0AAX4L149_9CREN
MSYIIRLLKFAVVGGIGTVINEGIYVLTSKVIPVGIALAIAIEISLLFNFILNDIWTFRDKRSGTYLSRLAKFHGSSYLGNIVQYIVAIVLLIYLLHVASISQAIFILFFSTFGTSTIVLLLTNLIGILAGFLVRFITSLKYVWA